MLTGGSSVNQLNWLYLGEIRFSDVTPREPIIINDVDITTTYQDEQIDFISTDESKHYNEVLSTVTLSMVTTDSVTNDRIKESGQFH